MWSLKVVNDRHSKIILRLVSFFQLTLPRSATVPAVATKRDMERHDFDQDTIVFWLGKNSKFHKTRICATSSARKKEILRIAFLEIMNKKNGPCKKCWKEECAELEALKKAKRVKETEK